MNYCSSLSDYVVYILCTPLLLVPLHTCTPILLVPLPDWSVVMYNSIDFNEFFILSCCGGDWQLLDQHFMVEWLSNFAKRKIYKPYTGTSVRYRCKQSIFLFLSKQELQISYRNHKHVDMGKNGPLLNY